VQRVGAHIGGLARDRSICGQETDQDNRNHYLNSKHGREHAGGAEGTGLGEAAGGKESEDSGPGMKG
jgi:hypothetical protein